MQEALSFLQWQELGTDSFWDPFELYNSINMIAASESTGAYYSRLMVLQSFHKSLNVCTYFFMGFFCFSIAMWTSLASGQMYDRFLSLLLFQLLALHYLQVCLPIWCSSAIVQLHQLKNVTLQEPGSASTLSKFLSSEMIHPPSSP